VRHAHRQDLATHVKRTAWLAGVVAALALVPLAASGGVFGQEANAAPAGPEQFVTAALTPAPTAPATSNSGCTASATTQDNVGLSWTDSQSATTDASGGSLVSGYSVGRATSAAGTYSSVGNVSGAPPATTFADTPSGAALPDALIVDGTAAGSGKAYTLSESSLSIVASTTIGTAGIEPNAVQVTPDGVTAVLAESTAGEVQVFTFSAGAWALVKTLTVTDPTAVAVDPVPNTGIYTAYVVSDRGAAANGMVYPVTLNGASSALGAAITVAHQADPTAIVVTPNGSTLYVANYGSHTVSAVNTSTSAVTSVALVGTTPDPVALAVTPDSSHVYVADRLNSSIDDITVSTDTVTAHVALAAGGLDDTILTGTGDPNLLAMTPSGTTLYVAEFGAAEVQQVNTALAATNPDTVVATVSTGAGSEPEDLAMSPNGCLVYVADWPSNDVFVIHTATNAESTAFVASCDTQDPQPMQVTPDNQYLVLPENYSCGDTQVLNTVTNAVTTLTNTAVGGYPTMVAVPPSPYYYEVTATHAQWTSNASTTTMVPVGWNPGGWQ
jgi:YVTN family beta-propeller protein